MFQNREKKVSRAKLATYAAALGRGSLAYQALVEYDRLSAQRETDYRSAARPKVEIVMGNNGFALVVGGKRQSYGA